MGPAAQLACAAGFLLVFAGTAALATKAYASRRHIEVELLASPVFQGVFALLGTAALSLIAGAILGQAILVTRYLTCALVPYSLALAVLFARYRNKVVWTLCVGLLLVSGSAQLSALTSAYSPANTQPLAYYDKATSDGQGGRVHVVSGFDLFSDIQAAGPLSVHAPNVPIAYVDSWPAYRAFEPTITFGERLQMSERLPRWPVYLSPRILGQRASIHSGKSGRPRYKAARSTCPQAPNLGHYHA